MSRHSARRARNNVLTVHVVGKPGSGVRSDPDHTGYSRQLYNQRSRHTVADHVIQATRHCRSSSAVRRFSMRPLPCARNIPSSSPTLTAGSGTLSPHPAVAGSPHSTPAPPSQQNARVCRTRTDTQSDSREDKTRAISRGDKARATPRTTVDPRQDPCRSTLPPCGTMPE